MKIRMEYGRRQVIRLVSGGAVALLLSAKAGRVWAQSQHRIVGKRRVIMLDPGHGGVDPGAIGVNGTYEKFIALGTAREAARLLEGTGHFHVLMTRDSDQYIPLQQRVELAQSAGADLFMSVHADANRNHHIRGASVYTLSEKASDKEAAELAARENRSDFVAGVDLSKHEPVVSEILFDLARRQTNNMSQRFAQAIVSELGREVMLMDNTHRSAGFVVLKAPDIPSALVELGCLSNPLEEHELRRTNYQLKLAEGLARSVSDYFAHAA
ncbi:MAG TPA: N-acetylmuramoyl-L-alanine amidase [Xanthobacteraceae bacterium]|jgi:N-acetylmuramoyl-L-alanine amidase|nr:N-acetylmuramoyl-L-alanine amidase [Xanthobacteraceae bacterium]